MNSMIHVIENVKENTYEIHTQYDPIFIDMIKQVAGRRWRPEFKLWTIPRNRLGFLLNQVKGTPYESMLYVQSDEDINVNAQLGTTNFIPEMDISDVTQYVEQGGKLFEHQVDFLKFARYRQDHGYTSGFILADQPGTGKTLMVMNLALYNKEHRHSQHCLVVACVNSAKYNWKDDIRKHTNNIYDPYILGSRLKRDKVTERYDTGGIEKQQDLELGKMYGKESNPDLPYFLLVNIEAFRYKQGRKHVFSDKIIEWVNDGKIDMIVLDEIHRNTSPSSKQGQQLLQIKQSIKQEIEWIPMTGTPITSKPTDVFLPLKLVGGHSFGSYYDWCQHFCLYGGFGNHDVVAYKNIPELKQMLEPNMLRRLKKDILDLPPKIRYTEYVTNSSYQEKLYEYVSTKLVAQKESIVTSLNPMLKLLRLRQVNGSPELVDDQLTVDRNYISKNAKLQRLMELLEDIEANGEKVVVFSNWVEPLRTLYKFISQKYKTCCYTGTMAQAVREQHKAAFINNPKYTVMLGTVGALGTSHTLTVARNIIFYDEPWNPADVEQCEDRCHRPGTTQSVNIYTIVTKGTVDENVHEILRTKEGISNYIVDGKLDMRSHPELFDMLLGNSNK